MVSLTIALVVLGCSYGAALVGTFLHDRLPATHLDDESRDVVKLVMGLVATMAALVLGLLVASANASHDRQTSEVREAAADIILLDRTLAMYGPAAKPFRVGLREMVRQSHDAVWSRTGVRPENLNSTALRGATMTMLEQVGTLEPKTQMEQMLKLRALDQADRVATARLQMFEARGGQISWPFLAVLIFWLSMLFLGFGVLAHFNMTVAVTQLIGAVSVAGAIFLILELNEPYGGLMRISDAPLLTAMEQLGR